MVQLVSHVFAPSRENACSQRAVFGPLWVTGGLARELAEQFA